MNRPTLLAVLMLAGTTVVCEPPPPVVAPPALPLPVPPGPRLFPQQARPPIAGFAEERVEVREAQAAGIPVDYVTFALPEFPPDSEDRPEEWYLVGPNRTLRVSVEYDTASPEDIGVGDEVVIWLSEKYAGVGERTAWVPVDVRRDELVEEPERLTLRLSLEPLPGDFGELMPLQLENDRVEVMIADFPRCCPAERLEVRALRTRSGNERFVLEGSLTARTDVPLQLDITTPYALRFPNEELLRRFGPWPGRPIIVGDWRVETGLGWVRHSFTWWWEPYRWDDPVSVELDAGSGRGLVYDLPSLRLRRTTSPNR